MAKITGNTFAHRNYLRTVGNWNGVGKFWTVPDNATEYLDAIRNLGGMTVTLDGDAKPETVPTVERKPVPVATQAGRTIVYGNRTDRLNTFADKNPIVFAGFQSLNDCVEFVANINYSQFDGRRSTGWQLSSWNGTNNMKEALDLARNGWSTGVDKAKEALAILEADQAKTRQRLYSVAGGRVNVGKMLAGNPLHMSRRARQPGKKVVTLFVELVMSNSVPVDDAINRAASVASMCDLLELSGYSCEIVGVNSSRMYQVTIELKAAGEALNLNDLVFALGHPSMLRRLCFAIAAVNPAMSRHWGSMGETSVAFDDTTPVDPGSFYIGGLTNTNQNRIKGKTFIERVRSTFPIIVPDNFPVTLR